MIHKLVSLLRWFAAVFFCTMFVVFAVSNRDSMTLDLFPLPYVMELPKFLYAVVFLSIGVLIGWYSCYKKIWRLSALHRKDEVRIAALENELAGHAAEQTVSTSTVSLPPKP